MRKHSVRKWIHAICDMLPLLVIPIFALAVRSDNNFQPIEITIGEQKTYHGNQLVQNGLPTSPLGDTWEWSEEMGNSMTYYQSTNSAHVPYIHCEQIEEYSFADDGLCYYLPDGVDIQPFDIFYIRFNCYCATSTGSPACYFSFYATDDDEVEVESWFNFNATRTNNINNVNPTYYYTTRFFTLDDHAFYHGITTDFSSRKYARFTILFDADYDDYYITHVQLINVSAMFNRAQIDYDVFYDYLGSGFNYIDYTLDTPISSGSSNVITYNDTDVGSQMVYTLYNTCDKYFNFNQVGVFNSLYNSIVNNFFNGVAPLGLYIVWNIVLFEFIMDVLFLVYMVFMFIIDFTESMIDRAFYKADRGCK